MPVNGISLREEMHGWARLQIALARMDGHKIDKRVCRYNELVETGMRYARCGVAFQPDAAWGGLKDAIDSCIIGDPMHTGESALGIAPEWMVAA